MSAPALADELNGVLASESRGMMRFVDAATPYLSPRTFAIWTDVRRMAGATADHAERLTTMLESLEAPVRAASFSTDVARYHYATIESILPVLIEEKRAQIAAYHRAIDQAAGRETFRSELSAMLEENQVQLEALEAHRRSVSSNGATP